MLDPAEDAELADVLDAAAEAELDMEADVVLAAAAEEVLDSAADVVLDAALSLLLSSLRGPTTPPWTVWGWMRVALAAALV